MNAGVIIDALKKGFASWMSRERRDPEQESKSDGLKRIEDNLREAETKYRIVADNAYDWEYWVNPEGQFVYVSPSCRRISGYEAEEFLANPGLYMEIIHPEDKKLVQDHWREVGEEPGVDPLEYRILCRDGSVRWIGHVCQPVFDEGGKFLGRRGSDRSITKRKKTEAALQETEVRYRHLVEHSPYGIAVHSEGKFVYINQAGAAILGAAASEEVVGKSITDIIHPDSLESVKERIKNTEHGRPTPPRVQKLIRFDGSTFHAEVVGIPFKLADCSATQIIFQDITERKRLEEETRRLLVSAQEGRERLSTLINSMQDEVWFADTQNKFTVANPSALREFGYGDTSNIDVKKLAEKLEVYRPDGNPRPVEDAPPLRALKGEVIRNESEIIRTPIGGALRHRQVSSNPVRDQNGNIIGSVTVVRDVTEQKKAEEALNRSEERLRAVVDNLPVGVWFADETGKILYGNPTGQKIWSGARWVGPEKFHDYKAWWADTGKPLDPEDWAVARAVRRGETSLNEVLVIQCFDGSMKTILNSAVPFYASEGRLSGVVVLNEDITERKRAEVELVRLASFPKLNPNPVIETDFEGNVHFINPAAQSLFPDLSQRKLGHPFLAVWGEFTSVFREGTMKARERDAIVNGHYYHQTVLFVDETQRIRIYGLDITDLKKAEEELRKTNRRLEILAETASRLLVSGRPQMIISDLCRNIMSHLDCQVFFNYLVDEKQVRLHLNACDGIPEETARDIEWLDFGVAVCGCVAREGRRIVAEHIFDTPDSRTDLVRSFGIQAYACHPLISEGRVIGTLSFGTRTKPSFAEDDLAIMRAVTDQVSIAMERLRYIDEIKTARKDLQKSHDALEARVRERTEELWHTIARLEAEVTERRKAEDALRESQGKLYDTLESITDGFFTLNRGWRFTYLNSESEKIWKMRREELIGKNIWEISPVAVGTIFEEQYRKAMIERVSVHFEALSPLLKIWVEIRAYPTAEGIAVHARDISRRKKDEEALKLATAYNRSLIEVSLDPLVTIDRDGRISDVNVATEHATGWLREELIGTDFSDYFTDREEARRGYRLVFQEGSVRDYALEIRHRDGKVTPVLYNATVYRDEAGKVVGVFAAARDISKRKRAEEALRLATAYTRSLIEASLDPLVTIDPDGRISDVNAATEHASGYSREELIGTDFSDYFTEPALARKGYRLVFQEGSVRDYPLEIRHRDGQMTPVLYNATLYRDEAGNVTGVFAAARDISRQLEVEKKLRESNEQLRALTSELVMAEESARRRIAVDLHDHVSQNLAVAKLRLETLQERASESGLLGPLREVRDLISESIQQTRSLITELSPSVLYELGFNAAMEWLTEQVKTKHGVIVQLESDLKTRRLDQDLQVLLFQTVRELLINIVKHAKAGHASVSIREIGDHIRIRVTDDGVGFDKSRLGNGMDREGGFGLFSIRERLEHFGARLEITTRPGKGTSVTIEAPHKKRKKAQGRMRHVH